ncbi:hypothetical protein CCP3SC15_170006 [Gammaproteobacteria bacterium]
MNLTQHSTSADQVGSQSPFKRGDYFRLASFLRFAEAMRPRLNPLSSGAITSGHFR